MVQWNTSNRGVMREDEKRYHNHTDYDGLSCADFDGLPGRGARDVEDLTMLSGIKADHETADRKD